MLDLPDTKSHLERRFRPETVFPMAPLLRTTAGNRRSHAMTEMQS
jgi:hypothetical protein